VHIGPDHTSCCHTTDPRPSRRRLPKAGRASQARTLLSSRPTGSLSSKTRLAFRTRRFLVDLIVFGKGYRYLHRLLHLCRACDAIPCPKAVRLRYDAVSRLSQILRG